MRRREAARLIFLGAGFAGLGVAIRAPSMDVLASPERYFEEAPPSAAPRTLAMQATPLGGGKLRVQLALTGLALAGICGTGRAGTLEGHVHLFVDGLKRMSMVTPVATLDDLPPGPHEITVSFSRPPTHRVVTVEGVPLTRSATVTVF